MSTTFLKKTKNNAGPIAIDRVITERRTLLIFKSKNPCIINCPVIVPERVDDCPEASRPIAHIYFPAVENVLSRARLSYKIYHLLLA